MMSANNPQDFPAAGHAQTLSAASLNDRLAEAAHYAVLNRLMPVLRHDVAGAMQPTRMLLMVLEKRLQAVDPDFQAIAKNVTSVSTLSKQASASCLAALGWMASSEDVQAGLQNFVDEAIILLAMELFNNSLTLVNSIENNSATASLAFLRSVLMGALLAFCDQHVEGGTVEVTLASVTVCDAVPRPAQLLIRMLPGERVKPPPMPDVVRRYRMIGWSDVEALARASGVQMAQGDGWISLSLPGLG